jgi:hypothetical protein
MIYEKKCHETKLYEEDAECPDFVQAIKLFNGKKYTDCKYRNCMDNCTALLTTSTKSPGVVKTERTEE